MLPQALTKTTQRNEAYMSGPDWRRAERELNEQLGVEATVSSGNQWYEKGDGETKGHPLDTDAFRFQVDEKSTCKTKYPIDVRSMNQWCDRATQDGKVFLLPIRFEVGRDRDEQYDYVVLSMKDFRWLLGLDEVIKYRRQSKQSKDNKAKFEACLSKALLSLDNLASNNKTLDDEAKTIIWKAIDIIDESMDEL